MIEFLNAVQSVTPIGIITILSLVILYQLVGGKDIMNRIRGTQIMRTYKTDSGFESVNKKLDLIMGNHLHELPDMKKSIDAIIGKVDDIAKEQVTQGNRLTRVETLIQK